MKDTKNNCGMHESLVAYLYGEASGDESRSVQTHLSQCPSCTEELEAFERVRGMLQHWQLDDLPVVRVAVGESRRSFTAVLRELFAVASIWAKAAAAVATVLLLLAIVGTDIRIGAGGVTFHADLLKRKAVGSANTASLEAADVERVRNDLRLFVNQLMTESEQKEKEALRVQLAALTSELQTAHSADLARLKSRIEEHQVKLQTLERDIDRREGTDLTDILFSEVTKKPSDDRAGNGGED
jgi:hypothetical protein